MTKQRTMNIDGVRQLHFERCGDYSFCIVVINEKYKIKIRLSFWWINVIASEIWKQIDWAQSAIDQAQRRMRRD